MRAATGSGGAWSTADLLAAPDDPAGEAALRELVREALGVDVEPVATRVDVVDYQAGSPATGALLRVSGLDTADRPWSLFCKVLQHVRHWPPLAAMPPQLAAQFAAEFPWRSELLLWDEPMHSRLPDGLRAPVLHRLVDLGDDRVAVWMEDIHADGLPWDTARYAAAARALARWNARCADPGLVSACPWPPGFALRMYAEKAVLASGLGPLRDDALWAHPWLAPHADLRRRLLELAPQIPVLLDELDTCPQCLPHGDASPQNLLVPVEEPDVFVAIDISFTTPHAVGFDLGQLLVGLVHAGEMAAARLPRLTPVVLGSYLSGLHEEGLDVDEGQVARAFAVSVVLRSAFDSWRLDLLDSDDAADRHTFDERVALSRFLVGRLDAAVGVA